VQFDSLADVVSFGIAPAVMAYAWGLRSLPGDGSVAFQQIGEFGWVCCLAFLICCAWRLARFNVQGMAPGKLEILCGHADAGGGGNACGAGARIQGTAAQLALVGGVVPAGGRAGRG